MRANFKANTKSSGWKGYLGKKWSNERAQISRDARPILLPSAKSRVKESLRRWNFAGSCSFTCTMCVLNFIQIEHISAKKGWRRKKWWNHKAQTSRDARPTLLPITKSWVKCNVGSWDFICSLVNYLHYVCAKIHPNRTIFSVKRLARKKVVKAKTTNFTRCSTYSASIQTIMSQVVCRNMKRCF